MRVTVIGTGYIGTVTGACLAYLGHSVTCVDSDARKIEILRSGGTPIYEPGLDELILLGKSKGGLNFETDLAPAVRESDIIFIAVGTPPLPSGESNLTYLESAARGIGAAMDPSRFRVVINKSTVPVGSGTLVETLIREGIEETHPGWNGSVKYSMASNPEFLREGSAVSDSMYPDRIVIGTENPQALAMLRELYAPLIEQNFAEMSFAPRPARLQGGATVPLVETTITNAEMIKYCSNAFLALKIGFANEMSHLCEKVGADITDVMKGIGLDSRIGKTFLNAGIGWGGSCFGKDISSLLHTAAEYGYQARILESSMAVNRMQRGLVIQKLQEKLYILKGRTITLLGLAFKPNTDDLRDAPSLQIIERLLQMGVRVRVFDPVAMPNCREQNPNLRVSYCPDAFAAADHADALVIVTEWPEFAKLDLPRLAARMNKAVLIDGRNLFDPTEAIAAGFDYTGVGRSTPGRRVTDRSAARSAALVAE